MRPNLSSMSSMFGNGQCSDTVQSFTFLMSSTVRNVSCFGTTRGWLQASTSFALATTPLVSWSRVHRIKNSFLSSVIVRIGCLFDGQFHFSSSTLNLNGGTAAGSRDTVVEKTSVNSLHNASKAARSESVPQILPGSPRASIASC